LKVLKQKAYFLLSAAILWVIASVFIFIRNYFSLGSNIWIYLSAMLTVTVVLAVTTIREYKKIKMARLIVENQILYICPAMIDGFNNNKKEATSPLQVIEVFISCFGILFDWRIIRFNQNGIHLKAVEIERDFISITYGTDKRTKSVRLLHAAIDSRELECIVHKFRYETGIVPIINNL